MGIQEWTWVTVGLTFSAYLYIGYRSRVASTKGFYVAGQGISALANGAATGADWMSAASFIGMAGLISFQGFDGSGGLARGEGAEVVTGQFGARMLVQLVNEGPVTLVVDAEPAP